MYGRSRATLFLIEKLIVITVFALCAAACVQIFAESFIMANDSKNMNNALVAAKNGAERFKAFEDLSETAAALGGGLVYVAGRESAVVYYDEDWQESSESGAAFVMRLELIAGEPPYICQLSVETIGREEILSFTVAANAGGNSYISSEQP